MIPSVRLVRSQFACCLCDRYGASLAHWSGDGAWAAYAAHNAVVMLRPGEHRVTHMLSGHNNRQSIFTRRWLLLSLDRTF